jgi:elongation factor 2
MKLLFAVFLLPFHVSAALPCFCCLAVFLQVIELAMEDKKDKLFAMLEKVGVLKKLKAEDKELVGKPLMKRVMQVGRH